MTEEVFQSYGTCLVRLKA